MSPVVKELKKLLPFADIRDSYEEDLVSYLLAFDGAALGEGEVLLIHSDQVFHRKPVEWQQHLLQTVATLAGKLPNKMLLSNALSLSFQTPPLTGSAGRHSDLFNHFRQALDGSLAHSNTFIFDFQQLLQQAGLEHTYQYNLGHLYQMPYTKSFVTLFAGTLADQVQWLVSEEKKAILIDCDNTLWKGILGENGLDGIQCDNNAEGILFYHFQLFLRARKEEGFLLCLCSKNNEADVKEAFETKRMPLSWNDFIVKKVNWEDKWQNIQQIARELNIGTDSLIFIDDNPFEINSVKELVKGITAIEFVPDYTAFLKMTQRFVFRRKRVLQEDLEKTRQYEVEFERQKEQDQFQNIEDFIKSLQIVTDIRENDLTDLERLAQMTGKTNQFNFNKREYTPDELSRFISDGNSVYSIKVADRFGDYGTVGLILVEKKTSTAIIENFLMSCRALGKRIEDQFYQSVIDNLAGQNKTINEIRFQETAKNKPAQDFYKKIKNEHNHQRTAGNISVGS